MLEDKNLEQHVTKIIVEVCEVLDRHGVRQVPIGAIMRLLGMEDHRAAAYDNEWFPLDDSFRELSAKQRASKEKELDFSLPPGSKIH